MPFDSDGFWAKMQEWLAEGYLVGASTKDMPAEHSIAGLVREHAYCILRTVDLPSSDKIMQVRNPWGVFEWAGDWSRTSPLWTPELIAQVQPGLDLADGSFWIGYKHFLENFETANVCMTRGWQELKLKGKSGVIVYIDGKQT